MSLDVSLVLPGQPDKAGSGIFVRKDGQIVEISKDEWNAVFPDRDPATLGADADDEDREVFWYNITHNLGRMAEVAGIYQHLWHPEELGITQAHELIGPLTQGLIKLDQRPDYFKHFNPPNGWGTYENLVEFVKKYLVACRKWPHATVNVSR